MVEQGELNSSLSPVLLWEEEEGENKMENKAGLIEIKKNISISQQAPKSVSAAGHTRPTVSREPVTGLQEEVQMVAQSLHVRHKHHDDTYKNWDLEPVRPILFIGDSNLGHLPPINNDKVEVDCYLGANLAQA